MLRKILLCAAIPFALPANALDGEVLIHDPSTVVQDAGHYFTYGTGNGLPILMSDDGWTWRRAGSLMSAVPGGKAGPEVLARGGNAVDAAVATAFALAVTYPSAGNIGGGGFMIVRPPTGAATAFDFREKAPLASTPKMYLKADGSIDRSLTAAGYLAPGVPGTVRGLEAAHKKFGKLSWKDVVSPAVELAEQGFVLSPALARSLNGELKRMAAFPASIAAYGKPGGGEWKEGDTIVLTDLGKTL